MKITWAKKSLWMVTGAILGASIVIGTTVLAQIGGANSQVEQVKESGSLPLQELRAFVEVFERISQDYVEPVDAQQLLEGAISGMLSSLDPHSSYLPPKDFKLMEERTTGEFGGLGMEVGMEDGFIKVISPIDGSPAKAAGIQAGDLIIKLDDERVKGKSLSEAVKIMRGKPGTKITLTIVRKDAAKSLELELTRAIIKVQSARGKMLTNGMGYVRISQFQLRTGSDVVKVIQQLEEDNNAPLKGLVLDLRNNPGGVLRAAVHVSDAFLNEGLIVYTRGRVEELQMSFDAKEGDVLNGNPLVILINEGSASASEIVAGALQDHKRALIIGRPSFGKGSVQTLIPLNNNGAIKLTTARYFTPSGHSIQAEGIQPDIIIDRVKVEKIEAAFARVKEKDLDGHLDHKDDKYQEGEDQQNKDKEAEIAEILAADYELSEALKLLIGMSFIQQSLGNN